MFLDFYDNIVIFNNHLFCTILKLNEFYVSITIVILITVINFMTIITCYLGNFPCKELLFILSDIISLLNFLENFLYNFICTNYGVFLI